MNPFLEIDGFYGTHQTHANEAPVKYIFLTWYIFYYASHIGLDQDILDDWLQIFEAVCDFGPYFAIIEASFWGKVVSDL